MKLKNRNTYASLLIIGKIMIKVINFSPSKSVAKSDLVGNHKIDCKNTLSSSK